MESIEFLISIALILSFLVILSNTFSSFDLQALVENFENRLEALKTASIISTLYSFGEPFETKFKLEVFETSDHSIAGFYCVPRDIGFNYLEGAYEYETYRRWG